MMIMNFRNSGKIETVRDCGNNTVLSSCLSEGRDIIYSEAILDPSGDVAGFQAVGMNKAGDLQTVTL